MQARWMNWTRKLCLVRQWSPWRQVAWRSTFTLPFIISPTLVAHAGDGRQRFAAAASANSLFKSLVSEPGQARSQADETLSLCLQAQAALVLVGLMSSRDFAKTLALVHSIASYLRFEFFKVCKIEGFFYKKKGSFFYKKCAFS